MSGRSRRRAVELAVVAVATLVVGAVLGGGLVSLRGGTADPTREPSAVDVGFAQDMAVHHDQAVLMAGLARERGGTVVRALAAVTETNQSQEIGTLRGWLALWGRPQLPSGPTMTWMDGGHGHGGAVEGASDGEAPPMPGLASVAELDRLRSATGQEFDRTYLELMTRHHQGGVVMAEDAALRAGLSSTRRFARTVAVAQANELTEMAAVSLALDRG